MQSLLCNSSLALLLLLDFNRGLAGVHGLQVQDGQAGEGGEVLRWMGELVLVVDDICVLSSPGQGGF